MNPHKKGTYLSTPFPTLLSLPSALPIFTVCVCGSRFDQQRCDLVLAVVMGPILFPRHGGFSGCRPSFYPFDIFDLGFCRVCRKGHPVNLPRQVLLVGHTLTVLCAGPVWMPRGLLVGCPPFYLGIQHPTFCPCHISTSHLPF